MFVCSCVCLRVSECKIRGLRLVGLVDGEFMTSNESKGAINHKKRKDKPARTQQQLLVLRMQAWARGSSFLPLSNPTTHPSRYED